MSRRDGLFRDEAIEFLQNQHGPGEMVRVSSAWTERAYWALLALVAMGVAAGFSVRIGADPLVYVLLPAIKTLVERLAS
jgi:hypothetical protein